VIRVVLGRRYAPDFKDDVGEEAYSELRLDLMLEELGVILDRDALPTIGLAGASYVLMVAPCP
jgi:hypothetical protein